MRRSACSTRHAGHSTLRHSAVRLPDRSTELSTVARSVELESLVNQWRGERTYSLSDVHCESTDVAVAALDLVRMETATNSGAIGPGDL